MVKKIRIIRRIQYDGHISYVIRQKHFLIRWWVDAWFNNFCGSDCHDSFSSLALAKTNLCHFDGSNCKPKCKDDVIYEKIL